MSSRHSENEAGYDLWSAFYDSYPNPTVAIDDLTFPAVYRDVRRRSVLEIGCGTGRHTRRLLEGENRVTGLDLSSGMLARLREKISDPNLSLIKGDFLSVALPRVSFDSIVASLVLEHFSDLARFFECAREVLKVGGSVFLSEIHPDRTADGIFAHFKNSDGVEIHLRSHAHSADEISEAARSCGFHVLETLSIFGSLDLSRINPRWHKYDGQPMIQIWKMRRVQ
jgi:malonyl-CoA O-methyltransferase